MALEDLVERLRRENPVTMATAAVDAAQRRPARRRTGAPLPGRCAEAEVAWAHTCKANQAT
jgi:hypothetical protein